MPSLFTICSCIFPAAFFFDPGGLSSIYTLVRRYEIDSGAVLLPVFLFPSSWPLPPQAFGRCMNSVGIHFSIFQAQGGSLTDTMTDIIAGSCGALIGAAFWPLR